MRRARLPGAMRLLFAALALLALAPLAAADEAEDATVGLNLGYVAPGLWHVYAFDTPGGALSLGLTWVESGVFPFADYDLRVYRPGSLANDEELDDAELLAESSQHPYTTHSEALSLSLAPGVYDVAVVPFQTQMERYTLSAAPGTLAFQANAFGYVAQSP